MSQHSPQQFPPDRGLYNRAAPLRTRIRTHDEYGTNRVPFIDWVISHIPWNGLEHVLDVGCGPGTYASAVAGRLTAGSYVGVDSSAAIIKSAQATFRGDERIQFQVGDAQVLPFPPQTFDVVLANHVLYHLRTEEALQEISRVLRINTGMLLAVTNSEHSMPELDYLHRLALGVNHEIPSTFRRFSLESGRKRLEEVFEKVAVWKYEDVLRFPEVEAVIAYYGSGWVYRTNGGRHDFELSQSELRRRYAVVSEAVARTIAEKGRFELHKTVCVFLASN